MKNGISKRKITIAAILGSMITLQLGAFSVTLETLASGVTELPFGVFVATMQPIHLAIGLVEGLITAAVLCFVYEARPELLWNDGELSSVSIEKQGKLSYRSTFAVLAVVTIVIAGLLSLAASANPDGLEWSIQRITGAPEVAASGALYDAAEKIQSVTAVLPDYSVKGSDSKVGTSFSGIIGGFVVLGTCVASCFIFRLFRRKTE